MKNSLFLKIIGLIIGSSLGFSVQSNEVIYSFVDAEGVLNFTDKPLGNGRPIYYDAPPPPIEEGQGTPSIYKFVDANGVIHLTDRPKGNGYQLIYQGDIPFYFSNEGGYAKSAKIHRKYGDYYNLVQEVATNTNLEAELLHAVIQTESAYNPKAISPAGAVGLMQLMPGTAKRYGVSDRTDVFSNLYGGARYLRYLLNLFSGNMELALAGYNAGENAVIRYGYQIPPYKETKNYVKQVLALYNTHKAK